MFTAPLWCLLFGATICLAVKDESPEENRREMNKALGKQFLKMLGLKKLPKLSEEAREKVREAQNKKDHEYKEKGKKRRAEVFTLFKVKFFVSRHNTQAVILEIYDLHWHMQ